MSKRIDLTGKQFGEWTVLRYDCSGNWICRCSCGLEKSVSGYSLRKGISTSCGCKTSKKFQDLTGKNFGEWHVISYSGNSMWKCRCSCGKEKDVHRYQLTTGKSKSCGHNTTAFKDIKGQKFGELTILNYLGNQRWECQCSCGKIISVAGEDLRSGHTKSCGHNTIAFKDIKGQRFGELTALEYLGNQRWKCQCSCGKVVSIAGDALRSGHTKSCGHAKSFIDLTDRQINDWTVLKYVGNQKFLCQCSCGKQQEVSSWLLRSGQSKSCGHSKIDVNDIVNKKIGPWNVIEYSGNYKYRCRCECGKELQLSRYKLTHMKQTKCVHTTIDYNSMVGRKYGEWSILEYLGNQEFKCRCSCGTERIIKERALRIGHTKSCGCKKNENFSDTMLSRYGEIATNKISNPREKWQIDLINNKEDLEALLLRMRMDLNRNPKLNEVSSVIGVNIPNTGKIVTKFGLNDYITYGTFSEDENILFNTIKDICGQRYEVVQRDRSVLNGRELDIYIPEKKLAIEYNGNFWHSSIVKDARYHQRKTIECNKKGIRLIHIFEYEWNDLEYQYKIMNIIEDLLEPSKKVINARDCLVGTIRKDVAAEFLNQYHLQGNVSAEYLYGIADKNDLETLLGIMSFGKPRFNQNYQYELLRLCWKPGIIVNGGTEKMFKHFVDDIKPDSVITYSDASKFTGKVYERLGFEYLELTDPNYKWVRPNSGEILSRYQTQKQKLLDQGFGTPEQTEDEIMTDLGYFKISDCGNYKYEYR